jgi:hypothetical protein
MTSRIFEAYTTDHFYMSYGDHPLPCTITNKKLEIDVVFTEFRWQEGDSGWPKKYDGDGEPHAVEAISADGRYRISISTVSPAAQELLRRGLVQNAPSDTEVR